MECKFFVGQKVVCVDDEPDAGNTWRSDEALVKGRVYTVSGVRLCSVKGNVIVDLAGMLRRPLLKYPGAHLGYRASRFRPAYDIQQFRDIAEKARREGRVTVKA